jgi:hypothetical protein
MSSSAAERMIPSLQFMVIDLLSKSAPTPLSLDEMSNQLTTSGSDPIEKSDVEDALAVVVDGGAVHKVPAEKQTLYLLTRPARMMLEILSNEHLSSAELAARTGH